MEIRKDRVVSIDYVLTNDGGEVLDRSEGEPLEYLHGNDNIIAGLERQLEGKSEGDALTCVVEPADAYGLKDDELVFNVSKSDFADPEGIKPGMQFQMQDHDGVRVVTVVGLEGDEVKIDANHPLAGQRLSFSVNVRGVREASAEELEHGHVHGQGHCHDDDECGCGCGDGACDDEGGCGCGGCHG